MKALEIQVCAGDISSYIELLGNWALVSGGPGAATLTNIAPNTSICDPLVSPLSFMEHGVMVFSSILIMFN